MDGIRRIIRIFITFAEYSDYKFTITLREKCPNTELFLVRIQSEYRKIRTRNNPVFGHFSRSVIVNL